MRRPHLTRACFRAPSRLIRSMRMIQSMRIGAGIYADTWPAPSRSRLGSHGIHDSSRDGALDANRFSGGSPIGRRHGNEVPDSVGSNPTRRSSDPILRRHREPFLTADCKSVVDQQDQQSEADDERFNSSGSHLFRAVNRSCGYSCSANCVCVAGRNIALPESSHNHECSMSCAWAAVMWSVLNMRRLRSFHD